MQKLLKLKKKYANIKPSMKPIRPKTVNRRRFYLEPEKILIIKQVLLGLFLFSIVSLLLVGVWYGTRVDSLTIVNVEAVDSETIKAEVVKAKVNEVLSGDYWHFIPRRFSWFYPEEEVIKKLEEIERIKDVHVEKISGTELKVTFSEYTPYALWCSENNENCYFIDEKGFAFGRAPELTGESLVRHRKLGEEPQLRATLISEDDFSKIKEFNRLLALSGWYVAEVEVDTVKDVFYILGDGSEIRATLESDSDETFTYFDTLRKSEEFAHLQPGNFQYIDLRFGEKVYVNEESDLAVASSTETKGDINVLAGEVSDGGGPATTIMATSQVGSVSGNEERGVSALSVTSEIASGTESLNIDDGTATTTN